MNQSQRIIEALTEAKATATDVENTIRDHLSDTTRKTTPDKMFGVVKSQLKGKTVDRKLFDTVWKKLVKDDFLVKNKDGTFSWET